MFWTTINSRTLFMVHIPKTGGSYVTFRALAHECEDKPKLKRKHKVTDGRFYCANSHGVCARSTVYKSGIPAEPAMDYLPAKGGYGTSLRFAIIRNPLSWLVSFYEYSWPTGKKIYRRWEDFVSAWCDPNSTMNLVMPIANRFRRFPFFQAFDDEGYSSVHVILRQEHLNAGLDRICRHVGIKARHRMEPGQKLYNTSAVQPWRDYYQDSAIKAMALKHFSDELDVFGYSLDGPVPGDAVIDAACYRYDHGRNKVLFDKMPIISQHPPQISVTTMDPNVMCPLCGRGGSDPVQNS